MAMLLKGNERYGRVEGDLDILSVCQSLRGEKLLLTSHMCIYVPYYHVRVEYVPW